MKRHISARVVGALGLTAVLLLVGACSSGSDEAKDDDKKESTSDETTTTTAAETMSDEEFIGEIDVLTAAIGDAGGDLCAIVAVGQEAGPAASASTPAQVESLIKAQVSMLRAFAQVEPVDEANAAALNGYADRLLEAGESADFSVEFLGSDEMMQLQQDQELTTAMGTVQQRAAAECSQGEPVDPAADPSTTEPVTTEAP